MIIKDGIVQTVNVEPDSTGLCTSLSGELLKQL